MMVKIMEKKYQMKLAPGTAGLAQRIPPSYEKLDVKLYILKKNELLPCGQNQF